MPIGIDIIVVTPSEFTERRPKRGSGRRRCRKLGKCMQPDRKAVARSWRESANQDVRIAKMLAENEPNAAYFQCYRPRQRILAFVDTLLRDPEDDESATDP